MDSSFRTRATLLQRAQDKSDERAWADFVAFYKGYLYVAVRNLGLAHHDVEDVLQDVFSKVWDKLPRFKYMPRRGRFRHWLCAIARNSAIDFVRRRKSSGAENLSPLPELELQGAGAVAEIERMAEAEWRDYLANLALTEARKSLPGNCVECFVRFAKGSSPAEIAKELSLSESSVYVYSKKTKDLMRGIMRRLEAEYG